MGLWEGIPLYIRAVYICWLIYAIFYLVILRYEKEHDLVKRRTFAKLNHAYSFYVLLAIAVFLDRLVIPRAPSYHFTNDEALYDTLATIGYFLMTIGLLVVISGRITLNGFWGGGIYTYDPNFKDFVRTGLYRIVRHPVYFGQILLALGMALIMNISVLWLFPLLTVTFNVIRARAEEVDLHARVGDEYDRYRNATSFIIPWF